MPATQNSGSSGNSPRGLSRASPRARWNGAWLRGPSAGRRQSQKRRRRTVASIWKSKPKPPCGISLPSSRGHGRRESPVLCRRRGLPERGNTTRGAAPALDFDFQIEATQPPSTPPNQAPLSLRPARQHWGCEPSQVWKLAPQAPVSSTGRAWRFAFRLCVRSKALR